MTQGRTLADELDTHVSPRQSVDSAHTCDVISKFDDLFVGERRDHIAYRRVIAVAGITLVFTQRLQQIVLALIGDARHIIAAGKIRVVTEATMILLRQDPRALQNVHEPRMRRWIGAAFLAEEPANTKANRRRRRKIKIFQR